MNKEQKIPSKYSIKLQPVDVKQELTSSGIVGTLSVNVIALQLSSEVVLATDLNLE